MSKHKKQSAKAYFRIRKIRNVSVAPKAGFLKKVFATFI